MLPDKGNKMPCPKTRFTSRDKSREIRPTSSSRLKSFPAEKIKKLDNPPMFSPEPVGLITQQDPRETGTFLVGPSVGSNNGYGDATANQLLPLLQQSQPQNVSDISQQQIAMNQQLQQIRQASSQSEGLLTGTVASPERQMHRPFVPNIPQEMAIRDRSPGRNPSMPVNQRVIIQNPSMQAAPPQVQQFSCDSRALLDQSCNEALALDAECGKRTVRGRTAADHRQMVMQIQQQTQAQPAIVRDSNGPLNTRFPNSCQCVNHPQLHASFQQSPRQIYQQLHHRPCHEQMAQQALNQMQPMLNQQRDTYNKSRICHSCYNLPLSMAPVSVQGMTSPQDMKMNQMRSLQRNLPVQQQNFVHPVVGPQSAWPQDDRWLRTASQHQTHLYQQPSLQWQYYRQMHENSQSAAFNQQNAKNQGQCDPSQNQTNRKPIKERSSTELHDRQGDRKNVQFTPDMIRDQELLVSTMRQQGLPHDVMCRQFDALLNEQRRHLAYIAQFQRQDHEPEIKKAHRLVRKTVERDEKPEWMVHITPPRISYSEMERMKVERGILKGQNQTNEQSPKVVGNVRADQYPNQQKNERDQVVPSQYMHLQMNPHHLLQQQTDNWVHRNNQRTTCGCSKCYLYDHQQNGSVANNVYLHSSPVFNGYNQQRAFDQHLHNTRYYPYHSPCEQHKACLKDHNLDLSNAIDNQIASMDSVYRYRQCERPVEPSSLLKMRMYKQVIRPQKCNNGLQDPETVQKTLEALKDQTSKRSLEYLNNLTKRKPIVRLNGIQDPGEVTENLQMQEPMETTMQMQRRISANGLENSRNPGNPLPSVRRPSRADEPTTMEYPRQRQNSRMCYSMQAERENGTVAISQQADCMAMMPHVQDAGSIPYDQRNTLTARNNTTLFQFGGIAPQYYQQMQRYYHHNGQNFTDHNGGQGDVANMQRLDAPDAMRIDRAGGDTVESSNVEETMKCLGEVQGTKTHEQPDIREARTTGGITYLVKKSDYAPNNFNVSPEKLIANRHLQPPRIS